MNRIKTAAIVAVGTIAALFGAVAASDTASAQTSVCRTRGHNVCDTPRYRIAVARLSTRPALIKPGAWQSPAGPALVAECLASYPNRKLAPANAELMSCLTQPDPRSTDRGVMTLHQHHLNHVNHANRR